MARVIAEDELGFGAMRRRSRRGSVVTDVAFAASRLSWRGCLGLGVVGFSIFYWLLPLWLHSHLDGLKSDAFRVAVDQLVSRRVHWLEWIGTAIALICAFFAARDYYRRRRLDANEVRSSSLLARLVARLLD